jgi:hypothetical protein
MTEKIESRIELTDRLRREGRDEEASLYRNQVREQLRAEGKTRKEAMEGAWEATRLAFPPLPTSVQVADMAAQTQVSSTVDEDDEDAVADEDWVIEWFSPLSTLARWQAKHGVSLTDEALAELLERLLGSGFAWAWFLGAKGHRPPSVDHLTNDSLARVAALIECTFEDLAEVMTVEELTTFRSTAVPSEREVSRTLPPGLRD